MKTQTKTGLASILAIVLATAAASAQQAPSPPPTTPYGPPIGLEAAKKVMAAAEAESVKNNWGMAIAILDSTGHIVMLHEVEASHSAVRALSVSAYNRGCVWHVSALHRPCIGHRTGYSLHVMPGFSGLASADFEGIFAHSYKR
jgi:Haem-degrading